MVGTARRRLCPPDVRAQTRATLIQRFKQHPPNVRGRRECRVKASPAARLQKSKQAADTTGSAKSSGIPCAMVLRLIRDLPGEPGFLAPIIALTSSAQLVASVGATGPHDFAVRVDAARLATSPHPSHPASRSVTIGQNALCIE